MAPARPDESPVDPSVVDPDVLCEWMDGRGLGEGPLTELTPLPGLAALSGSDVPHPGLIAAEPDADVLGAAFYLMEPVDGFTPTTGLPGFHAGDPTVRRAMGFVAAVVDWELATIGDP